MERKSHGHLQRDGHHSSLNINNLRIRAETFRDLPYYNCPKSLSRHFFDDQLQFFRPVFHSHLIRVERNPRVISSGADTISFILSTTCELEPTSSGLHQIIVTVFVLIYRGNPSFRQLNDGQNVLSVLKIDATQEQGTLHPAAPTPYRFVQSSRGPCSFQTTG